MSKWMFTADWHIQDDSLMDRTIGSKYFEDKMNILSKIIRYVNENGYEKLFILGDVFDSPNPSIKERIAFHEIIKKKNDNYNIHIILGNHDFEKNGLDFFHEMGYLTKYTKEYYEVCYGCHGLDGQVLLQSWGSEDKPKFYYRYKFWLGHAPVKDFYMSEITKCKSGLGLDDERFERYKYCIFGHFHIPSKVGNMRYVGSPYPVTFGEGDKEKRVLSYDSDTDKITSIPIVQITDGPTLGLSTLNIREKKHIKMIHHQVKESGNNSLKGTILRLKYNPCIVKRSKIDRLANWLNEYNPPYYIDIIPEGLSKINTKSVDKDVNRFTFLKNFSRYMKLNWKDKKLKRKALKILAEAESDSIKGT